MLRAFMTMTEAIDHLIECGGSFDVSDLDYEEDDFDEKFLCDFNLDGLEGDGDLCWSYDKGKDKCLWQMEYSGSDDLTTLPVLPYFQIRKITVE